MLKQFKIKTIIRNIIRKDLREFYIGLMFPEDDYYLRYFGRQYGNIERKPLVEIFPQIDKIRNITVANYLDLVSGTSLEINELVALITVARYLGVRDICEIGTFNGNTALNLAVNIPESRIITVDLPLEFSGILPGITKSDTNVTDRDRTGECFIGTKYEKKNITQVYTNSYDLKWSTFRKHFDLVLIDGCHHYKYVKKDTENALAHLKENGIIFWHDYGQQWGVSKAVDELTDVITVQAIRGTRFAVGYKKGNKKLEM